MNAIGPTNRPRKGSSSRERVRLNSHARGLPDAAAAIRELIARGHWKVGQRLPAERELAAQLHVGRNTLREAIRELSAHNILASRQGDGTYVCELRGEDLFAPLEFALRVDPRSLAQYYELRLILEPAVAATAAAQLDAAQIAELQQLVQAYEREVATGSPDNNVLVEADERIHECLVRAHGNPLIVAVLQSVGSVSRRGRELTLTMAEAAPESLSELRALVDAVAARDPVRAQVAMTRHVARWEDALRSVAHADNGPPDGS